MIDVAEAYAREFKDAARELRQAAVTFLKVADRLRGDLAFKVIIPAASEDVARLRELAELACDIVFKETVDD
jgi:hypothetical protein